LGPNKTHSFNGNNNVTGSNEYGVNINSGGSGFASIEAMVNAFRNHANYGNLPYTIGANTAGDGLRLTFKNSDDQTTRYVERWGDNGVLMTVVADGGATNALTLSGSTLDIAGTQDLSGVVPDSTSILRLSGDSTVNDSAVLSVGTLALENFALTLDDTMAGLRISQVVALDASTEKINSGAADLMLNGGITVSAGTLSSSGGTLTLPAGATAASGGTFTTSGTTIQLGGSLNLAESWTSTNTNLSLTANAELSSSTAVEVATLETNGFDFMLGSETSDLTLANAFTLSSGTISTQGGDLIFKGSADISTGATLDASATSGTGGKLELQQGGTASGTINITNATFKIGSGYTVNGTLLTNSTTSMELGNSNLDLSDGTLELGGNLTLDQILTSNQTQFKLTGNATIIRNVGFTIGGMDFGGYTMTLGSPTTDLTLDSSSWKLIAKQANIDEQRFSSNARNTFLENENDSSQSTFMSIGNLDKTNYADSTGEYKFKLVWGGKSVDSSGINKEVSWTQTSWLTESSIQGFQEIGASGYDTSNGGSGFQGLGKSSDGSCVIDGNGGSASWWNCAGANTKHDGGIPGPNGKIASSMYLYIERRCFKFRDIYRYITYSNCRSDNISSSSIVSGTLFHLQVVNLHLRMGYPLAEARLVCKTASLLLLQV